MVGNIGRVFTWGQETSAGRAWLLKHIQRILWASKRAGGYGLNPGDAPLINQGLFLFAFEPHPAVLLGLSSGSGSGLERLGGPYGVHMEIEPRSVGARQVPYPSNYGSNL